VHRLVHVLARRWRPVAGVVGVVGLLVLVWLAEPREVRSPDAPAERVAAATAPAPNSAARGLDRPNTTPGARPGQPPEPTPASATVAQRAAFVRSIAERDLAAFGHAVEHQDIAPQAAVAVAAVLRREAAQIDRLATEATDAAALLSAVEGMREQTDNEVAAILNGHALRAYALIRQGVGPDVDAVGP
jgi:hypothetical protein